MHPLMKLLIAIATAGMAMSALAMDQVDPGTLTPAVMRQADPYGASSAAMPRSSYMAAINFAVDNSYRTASAGAVKLAPARTGARPVHVAGLKLDAFAVASLPVADWPADGARFDLQAALAPGDAAARREGRPGGRRGDDFRFPEAAVPEPDKWTKLLCGLVVAGFMARRRTNPAAV